ncbi:polysaccharide pyruvyl transferase family protein [Xanthomonas perforans]|uniref:Polysaccharide pyruvyl transferase family protein n=1 Tax=Xanthomonas euvesicatoria TaxID=456327 RepID=A0AAX4FES1_XANEU|nr:MULTISPECIES: polysaccharide pyruvyl transferase family protein [Xanthomonas]OHX25945.1 polysaccharide biosynthesis protein GumL [Xanthomonas alfalfae]AEO42816.1 GumL protein [Xanthomonas euvesicatoria pv. citrumelo F1]MBO9794272.1 polysaccharide pyruvyl transferase family protein [Xanthomonas phaseoli pv. dieffenbachiae]MBO9848619.1 polysaccharide pyruvyl transferase family protein [Xanthomonas phaseoli pv. dieffenbachiae]MBV6788416.1 polysaccharide pyruvyl transferase family protein [Xant
MANALLQKWIEHAERRALFWWQPKNAGVNMGDHLSKVIVSCVLSLQDKTLIEKQDLSKKLIAIGSVLHFAKDGDTVWGSGINGKIPAERNTFSTLDVRAVRGPKTRKFLLDRGIAVPEVYGDPGLLTPMFFPADALGTINKRPFAIVPHFNEPVEKYSAYKDHLVFPNVKPATFMSALLGAELVISSSLHGLILAEAYGIPAVYLDWGNGEDRFKYDDYYNGTGRMQWHSGNSVEECLQLGGNGDFDLEKLQAGLLAAFPYDLW